MGYELIINSTQNGSRVGLLENRSLVEYQFEKEDHQFRVGDIYLGKVRKVVPGLNAAFIELGYEKDAFLHYLDLGPNFRSLQNFTKRAIKSKQTPSISRFKLEPEINKLGKINQVLSKNDQILVQIAKEPISTKGPRLSCELSLAGRYLVLVPFGDGISISKKISSSDERKRLQRLVTSIKPANFGVIIRTVAEGKEVAQLDKDLRNLVEGWKKGIATLKTAVPPQVIVGEVGKTSSILRDMLNKDFDSIVVDDKNVYNEVKGFINVIAPEKEKIVSYITAKPKFLKILGLRSS